LKENAGIAASGFATGGRHDDYLSVSGAFESQVAVGGAEFVELLVGESVVGWGVKRQVHRSILVRIWL
jgi:hypothetical protein